MNQPPRKNVDSAGADLGKQEQQDLLMDAALREELGLTDDPIKNRAALDQATLFLRNVNQASSRVYVSATTREKSKRAALSEPFAWTSMIKKWLNLRGGRGPFGGGFAAATGAVAIVGFLGILAWTYQGSVFDSGLGTNQPLEPALVLRGESDGNTRKATNPEAEAEAFAKALVAAGCVATVRNTGRAVYVDIDVSLSTCTGGTAILKNHDLRAEATGRISVRFVSH